MWQKCPICNGKGVVFDTFLQINSTNICPTCRGQRIISELTGVPPGTSIEIKTLIENDECVSALNKIKIALEPLMKLKGYKYAAMDKNESWYLFATKPQINNSAWFDATAMDNGWAIELGKLNHPPINWEESLIEIDV